MIKDISKMSKEQFKNTLRATDWRYWYFKKVEMFEYHNKKVIW